jgi:hypothetical protein
MRSCAAQIGEGESCASDETGLARIEVWPGRLFLSSSSLELSNDSASRSWHTRTAATCTGRGRSGAAGLCLPVVTRQISGPSGAKDDRGSGRAPQDRRSVLGLAFRSAFLLTQTEPLVEGLPGLCGVLGEMLVMCTRGSELHVYIIPWDLTQPPCSLASSWEQCSQALRGGCRKRDKRRSSSSARDSLQHVCLTDALAG